MNSKFFQLYPANSLLPADAGTTGFVEIKGREGSKGICDPRVEKAVAFGSSRDFSDKRRRQTEDVESREKQLFEEIGRLKFELDWLKKKSDQLRP